MLRTAEISPDGRYRYLLGRRWDVSRPRVVWIMLNPSTADAHVDDPTIRRCIGFTRRWGCGSMDVVNLYALRATEPRAVRGAGAGAVGPDNDFWIARACRGADHVVAAWGAFPWAVARAESVLGEVPGAVCLGLSREGMPRHPLYVRADAALVSLAGETRRTTGACRAPATRR